MQNRTVSGKSKDKCIACPAPCCRNLAMMILKPRTRTDIEELRWYLHFDTVSIYIRNYRWYLLVQGNCIYLDENNLCTIYDRRPERCRRHPSADCEMTGEFYDVVINTPEELEDYLNRQKKRRKKTG